MVKEARAALEAGCAVVVGLQSTGEAAADALGLVPGEPVPGGGFVSTARQLLLTFVETHFPTTRAAPFPAEPLAGEQLGYGGLLSEGEGASLTAAVAAAAAAAAAAPGAALLAEEVPEARAAKEELLGRIRLLSLPANPLDELVDLLGGPAAVAEMTGAAALEGCAPGTPLVLAAREQLGRCGSWGRCTRAAGALPWRHLAGLLGRGARDGPAGGEACLSALEPGSRLT